MNRLIFLLLMLAISNCGKLDHEKKTQGDFVLHENYYYSDSGEKMPLELCDDEFYVIVKKSSLNNALTYLSSNDFILTTESEEWGIYTKDPEYTENSALADCIVFCIKGTGNVGDIPGLVYSSNKYIANGSVIVINNVLHVEYDSEKSETDIERLKEIAKELNVIPLAKVTMYGYWYAMACTNESVGNSLEVANYIYEHYGLKAYSQTFDSIVPEL